MNDPVEISLKFIEKEFIKKIESIKDCKIIGHSMYYLEDEERYHLKFISHTPKSNKYLVEEISRVVIFEYLRIDPNISKKNCWDIELIIKPLGVK